ncbi:MAG: carboxypeptidase-like regulatory domain-containing protein, partial [Anaerolineae bacterium]|nr:carboxypeptidase-like regulatory domain-containing protein [Anaerolineae bacterium]
MELRDYPRPANDTGIGVHWSPGNAGAVGLGELRDYWLPELIALGVKWVKLLHDGGVEFAELLLQNDIMPIVRLYRYQPNSTDPAPGKGTLGPREIEYLERYVAVGVRYFEFNNEPELSGEWAGGQVPPNAEEIVARHAIIDMETILERGGYPAVPATAIGTKWDLVGKIVALDRRDLFDEPVWVAVHNYDINHPLDYPYDAVNQQGQQLTPEEYEELNRQGAWDGRNWGHRSREWINEQRRLGVNSGDTIHDDPSCWLAYTRFDDLVRQHLGRPLPILSTENGPIVGEDDDPRYPTTTPERHRDKVLEMCRIMMGTSSRFDPAPPQYFCTAFWLLGSAVLRTSGWEAHAWYSPTRPGGRLPVVDALKALPKQPRPGFGGPPPSPWEGPGEGVIQGWVRNGAGRRLLLDGPVSRATDVAADESFRFEQLPAGRYRLMVRGTELSREVVLPSGQASLTVDMELTPVHIEPPREGVLRGRVSGGAGYTLRLSGAVDRTAVVAGDETYRFEKLPAGQYTLTVEGTAVSESGIVLDGRGERVVDLTLAAGWTWEQWDGGPGPGFGVVRCAVQGLVNLPVHLWTDGWSGIVQRTGSKAEYGPYACEFAPLGGGHYYIEPEGLGVQADVHIDGRRVVWVEFREQAPPPPGASVIHGRVLGGARYALELSGPPGFSREARTDDEGSYRLEGLPAGTYSLQLLRVSRREVGPGEWYESKAVIADQALEDIELDGQNEVALDFDVRRYDPYRGKTVLSGKLPGGAGQTVVLIWPGGYRNEVRVGEDETFRFQELGAGTYELQVKDSKVSRTFEADGVQEVSLELWLPGAGRGVIWGRVRDGAGRQMVLEWAEGRQETAVANNGIYRFADLLPGEYTLRIEGTPVVYEGVRLGEGETVEVNLEVPPPKTMEHYLLVGRVVGDREGFLAALRYAARFGPIVGSDVEEARQAAHVTILGGSRAVSLDDERSLRAS